MNHDITEVDLQLNGLSFVVPCYQGKAMAPGGIAHQLADRFPEATIIPVFNGIKAYEVAEGPPRFEPVWSQEGLRSALEVGYVQFLRGGERALVRTDSDEHPIDRFEELINQARKIDGLVVGDLRYGDSQLMPDESPDRLAHEQWLEMYARVSRGRAPVGNAHGLLVFGSRRACRDAFLAASQIMAVTDQLCSDRAEWGHDGAMILGAVAADVPVEVVPIEATEPRNRPVTKIMDQFKKHFALLTAASRTFPDRLG